MENDLSWKAFAVIAFTVIVFFTIICVALAYYPTRVKYEKNGDYHYRCVGGVRYFYGSSIVLMRDVNDKPISCN